MRVVRKPSNDVAPQAESASGAVTVRMYRGLLGDCFLLRFPRAGRDMFVLIDDGTFLNMPREADTMRRVAESIGETANWRLDVVVLTHEHWDNLCGFAHAADIFGKIAIDELWLAWTEDRDDELACTLRKQRETARAILMAAHENMPAPAPPDDGETLGDDLGRGMIEQVLEFLGQGSHNEPGAPKLPSTDAIIQGLKDRAGKVRYLSPGDELTLVPGATPAQAYVLGPPRDEELFRRSSPSGKRQGVYQLTQDVEAQSAYLVAAAKANRLRLEGHDDVMDQDFESNLPFDRRYMQAVTGLRDRASDVPPWVARLGEAYLDPESDWRRIDHDWLGAAEQLALKLDSDTNNTSLALAFEIGRPGKVLLFPGDAQVENWLSWSSCRWPKGASQEDTKAIGIRDLLARTVLYKVSHHGSHNATPHARGALRAQGLELMTHRDLVAMIPIDESFARGTKKWNMPFPPLLERLKERTRGRILRGDRPSSEALKASREKLPKAEWETFSRSVTEDPSGLFVEYSVAF
jgi:hypothetical protein